MQPYVIPFQSLGIADIDQVGGKNASLGEMISNLSASGVCVPGGFATTAEAYRDFLKVDGLDLRIKQTLEALDVEDVTALAKDRCGHTWLDIGSLTAAAPGGRDTPALHQARGRQRRQFRGAFIRDG